MKPIHPILLNGPIALLMLPVAADVAGFLPDAVPGGGHCPVLRWAALRR